MTADGAHINHEETWRQDTPFTSGYISVPGADLYYEAMGQGHALVLLHGEHSDLTMWDEHVPVLAQQYRVVRYDQRGCGRSRVHDDVPYTRYDDLELLLTALEVERAHLLGSSLGGQVALDFAIAFPSMTTALIAVAADIGGFAGQSLLLAERTHEIADARATGDLDRAADLSMLLWLVGPQRKPRELPSSVRDRVRAMFHRALALPTPRAPRHLDPPALTRLDEVVAPALVIVGDRDVPEALRQSELLAMRVPLAHKVVVPNGAHLLHLEHPERFVKIVLDFLRVVDAQ